MAVIPFLVLAMPWSRRRTRPAGDLTVPEAELLPVAK